MRVRLFGVVLIGLLVAGCGSTVTPTSAGLVSAARSYWTDLSLRTNASLRDAYGYLDISDQTNCPETTFQRATRATTQFADAQISDARVASDDGVVLVTVTYLIVGFMDRDPDLPTATVATHWQWDGSRWRFVSPVSCSPSK
jgi:hypothetical protein